MSGPRLVVLGWDSATFDVVDPLVEAGRLPVLQSMIERGVRGELRSTWPPMTDCAWTGAFTGVGAGTHGIFGSWYRAPGAYRCRYFSSRDRRALALWEMAPGVRFLVWNVPMTFPPEPIEGVMVAGYGAPPGARFCAPDAFQDDLAARWPLEDVLDRAPHSSLERFLDDLVRGLEVQAEALPWAIRAAGADCALAVWPHVDRAQHFFWSFRGNDHALAGAVDRVYEAMDRATGAVIDAFPDADVVVVSDHGAGPLHGDVNVGAWLARRGRAAFGTPRRAPLVGLAWKMPPSLRRFGRRLAPGAARRAMGATLAGQLAAFDWSRTDAFLGFHSDLWLNLEGRESRGTVASDVADEVLDELLDDLLRITDPATGAPVFAAAHRRDEVYSGRAASLAPDAILDSWSAGYRIAPGRAEGEVVLPPAPLAGVDVPWSADHRLLGVLVAAGPRVGAGRADERSLLDVCPTALALLGRAVPEGLDGRPAEELIAPDFLARHPVAAGAAAKERDAAAATYSDDEAAAVAEHLKDLGYIE